jgi:pimeloyl-ACP methyl ester carboxylesterase
MRAKGVARVFFFAAVCMVVLVTLLHVCLLQFEQRLLLWPSVCRAYRRVPVNAVERGVWLPSGGLVVTIPPQSGQSGRQTLQDDKRQTSSATEVVFCHGNAGNLDEWWELGVALAKMGYCVHLLEYAGFGVTPQRAPVKPTTEGLVRDVDEAWSAVVQRPSKAILAGFSIGGGAVTQLLRMLLPERMPAQVVLMNTFASLPQLVRECLARATSIVSRVSAAMRTQWDATPGIACFLDARKSPDDITHTNSAPYPRLLVVMTKNDTLIGAQHSEQLVQVAVNCGARDLVKLVRIDDGGHAAGPLVHLDDWLVNLRPPFLRPRPPFDGREREGEDAMADEGVTRGVAQFSTVRP